MDWYVPAPGKTTLVSTIAAVRGGKTMRFTGTNFTLTNNNGRTLIKGRVDGKMYVQNLKEHVEYSNKANDSNGELIKLQRRLGLETI